MQYLVWLSMKLLTAEIKVTGNHSDTNIATFMVNDGASRASLSLSILVLRHSYKGLHTPLSIDIYCYDKIYDSWLCQVSV